MVEDILIPSPILTWIQSKTLQNMLSLFWDIRYSDLIDFRSLQNQFSPYVKIALPLVVVVTYLQPTFDRDIYIFWNSNKLEIKCRSLVYGNILRNKLKLTLKIFCKGIKYSFIIVTLIFYLNNL